MSGGTMPVNLTVYPVAQEWTGKPLHVQVINNGTLPLKITGETVLLHDHCVMSKNTGIAVTPDVFTLAPHSDKLTTVAATDGKGDFGVLFVGQTFQHHNVTLTDGVGAQILVKGARNCVPAVHHVAAVAPTGGGFPLLWVVVGLIALVLAVVGTTAWVRRRA